MIRHLKFTIISCFFSLNLAVFATELPTELDLDSLMPSKILNEPVLLAPLDKEASEAINKSTPSKPSSEGLEVLQTLPILATSIFCSGHFTQPDDDKMMLYILLFPASAFALKTLVAKSGETLAQKLDLNLTIGRHLPVTILNAGIIRTLMTTESILIPEIIATSVALRIGIGEILIAADATASSWIANQVADKLGLDPDAIGKTVAISRILNYLQLGQWLFTVKDPIDSMDSIQGLLKTVFVTHQFSVPVVASTLIIGILLHQLSKTTHQKE